MPKKAATPKKATKASSKKDEKKSVHQQFADIVANVDVDADKPKRVKKEVDRFDLEVLSLVPKATRETVFENGTGDALRDIASVAKSIRKHDGDDTVVKKVHQLLYNRPGKTHETKKNILRFSGLPAKGKKEGKERFHSRLAAWKMNDIRAASKLFLLDAGAPKEELVDALVDFLASPKTPKKIHKKKSITKKKPLSKKKKKTTTTTSESEAESSAVESESAAESESEKPRGRKRKASPSPKRGKKKTSASPKKRAPSRSRSTSRSRSVSRSRSPAASRGRSKTKKTSTPTKKRSGTPSKRKGSQSPKRRAASPSPKRTPTKKKGSTTSRKSASPSPAKKKKGSSTKKKGSTTKKRKTSH